ncbi:MAG: GIY-YIG nuclease family protein, partial [Pseudomonadota bacterium]|nr:GIY-YIG nuclease family protein [Pseudomonadota bacterium]
YPSSFFNKAKREFMDKDNDERLSENEKKPIVKIPFVGKPSILFAKRLKKLLMKENFPEVQPIYETTKIQDSFKLKDDQPKEILSNIVYDFTCSGDPSIHYVGHTSRSLRERFHEHIRGGTAISDHISVCDACGKKGVTLDNFQVIQRCRTKAESLIHEALFIKQENPSLNRQLVKIAHTFHLQVFN